MRGATSGLPGVGLDELNATAALTNRVDDKFLVPTSVAVDALAPLAGPGTRILQIDGRRVFGYRSTYFDTPDLWTFRSHRQQRRQRAKIRTRSYVDSGLSFLEVKLNGARDNTDKHRIPHPEAMTADGRAFVDRVLTSAHGRGAPARLVPVLCVTYSRLTLLVADGSARITCDVDLAWQLPDGTGFAARDDLVLIEVKSPPGRQLRLPELPRSRQGLSKYCLGITALHPDLSGNPWYRTVRLLSRATGRATVPSGLAEFRRHPRAAPSRRLTAGRLRCRLLDWDSPSRQGPPMTATATTTPGITTGPAPTRGWFAVVSVMTGLFAIVTTEILPIGLLVPIRDGFGVSDGVAGLTMTLPGLLAAVAAPLVTVATARLDRRVMLCVLMAVLAVANLLAALAPAFWVMLVSRILVGVVIGGFWSIGAGLAPRLVRAKAVSMATAVVFAAVPLGSVLGVPAGTFLGSLAGWRAAFAVMTAVSVAVLVALALSLPGLPPLRVTGAAVLRELLRRKAVRYGLLVTAVVVVAHFATYTYVTPLLVEVNAVDVGLISTLLLVYGVAGVAGNFVAGAVMARGHRAVFAVAALVLAAATLLLPLAGNGIVPVAGLLVLWGLAYGAVPACSQTWFARAAPDAPEAATVVFTASFQAALSAGALVGGVVVDATSTVTVMLAGSGLAVVAAALIAATRGSRRIRVLCLVRQPFDTRRRLGGRDGQAVHQQTNSKEQACESAIWSRRRPW
ncbi:major facilitator superfamily MFS_1 [Stackebrandtia nassauensis DSM 44728]|uniref:Major facilitator superfamily MFS_1 n=1 Tax=Stackebrandtia nassauensis (strain DSM 44728 / CIP 108903 / NRRL B-16338 / NBRC 102104 / LLR-40K-21) TaxID=446470 RepID=D3Q8V1_STANL|nr:major facilitator superfamily MFS_1 [Stackebrandtia nassauensis DSM 44728]